ncbi:hypothetical protein HYU06_05990 [Candidatus Woesearchaeota archaeon]|nr:hypothetical protein [Candidatus Woesearchaeota archaeon]
MPKKNILTKSQMEIMGIVIIIILFSVGLLFAIQYVILKKPTDVKKSFLQAELSSNSLNAMLKTNVPECNNADMASLFKDCTGVSQEIDCCIKLDPTQDCIYDGSISTTGMADTCYVLNQTINKILKDTLNVWRVPYIFTAYYVESDPLAWTAGITSDIPCTMEDEGRPQEFTLPTTQGNLRIVLKVC